MIELRWLFLALMLTLTGCASHPPCGENGTVDEDPNPDFTPPHCG
jgi:hypothetical protein